MAAAEGRGWGGVGCEVSSGVYNMHVVLLVAAGPAVKFQNPVGVEWRVINRSIQ